MDKYGRGRSFAANEAPFARVLWPGKRHGVRGVFSDVDAEVQVRVDGHDVKKTLNEAAEEGDDDIRTCDTSGDSSDRVRRASILGRNRAWFVRISLDTDG